jgi:hypothetical protein
VPRELSAAVLASLLAAAAAAAPAGPASSVVFKGFLTPWRQDCAASCGLPAGAGTAAEVSFTLAVPSAPGEARAASARREFVLVPGGETLTAVVTAYFVCPRDARPSPGDSCPTRFVQFQTELSGGASAFCGAALNPADAWPFPVLMCAGAGARRPGERLGVSLSRRPVSAAPLL